MGYDFIDDNYDDEEEWDVVEDYFDDEWTEADEVKASTRRPQAYWDTIEHYGQIDGWRKLGDVVELLKPVTRFDDEISF